MKYVYIITDENNMIKIVTTTKEAANEFIKEEERFERELSYMSFEPFSLGDVQAYFRCIKHMKEVA
jgi:hypothetical protein